MTARDNDYIDRLSFQSLLANAYSVQQSGMTPQSLAAIIEIQRTISDQGNDAVSAMKLIADRAQAVADASGIGIALLEGDQLVHRAGNGSASQIVGSQLTAVLGASSTHHPRREILRVEDAQNDTRIEADICRQFGAQALLMVPIYRETKMIGAIEVLFDAPHQFDEPEVRTYQLMSTLAGDASLLPAEPSGPVTASTLPYAVWRMADRQPLDRPAVPHQQPVRSPQDSPFVRALRSVRRGSRQWPPRFDFSRPRVVVGYLRNQAESLGHLRTGAEYIRSLVSRAPGWEKIITQAAAISIQRVLAWRPAVSRKLQWNALAICLVIALAIAAAVTRHQSRVLRVTYPVGQPETTAVSSQTSSVTAGETGLVSEATVQAGAPVQAVGPNSAFKRVRVGKNEVDYVADDVTIREFRPAPSQTDAHASAKQVNIGKDVTVRYFDSTPVSAGERPVSTTDQAFKD